MRPEGVVLLERAIDAADLDELAGLCEMIAGLAMRAQVRLWRYVPRIDVQEKDPELWLTPQQAATMLGESKRWVYSHWPSIPGARKDSPRQLRIPASGVQRLKAVR